MRRHRGINSYLTGVSRHMRLNVIIGVAQIPVHEGLFLAKRMMRAVLLAA